MVKCVKGLVSVPDPKPRVAFSIMQEMCNCYSSMSELTILEGCLDSPKLEWSLARLTGLQAEALACREVARFQHRYCSGAIVNISIKRCTGIMVERQSYSHTTYSHRLHLQWVWLVRVHVERHQEIHFLPPVDALATRIRNFDH